MSVLMKYSMGVLALLIGAGAVSAADDAAIGEMLVTAQKRTENVQDVPSSVSVMDGEHLDRINAASLIDYASYLPGFNVNSGGAPGETTLTLRGIAPVGPGAVVGTYVDDTPLGSSANFARATAYALDLMPDDIERVEVLRGPQGTLYGAGSMGGLLKYALRDPDLQEFQARVGLETSDTQSASDPGWGARASLNAPLVTDRLGLRLSAFKAETPAYSDNALTGEDDVNGVEQMGGRATLLWEPSDTFSAKLTGLWQRIDADNDALVTLELTGLDPPTGESTVGELSGVHPLDEPLEKDVDYYALSLNWDLGFGSLTSATSYSDSHLFEHQDASFIFGTLYPLLTGGAIPAGLNDFLLGLDLTKWTQEFRLASATEGRIEWLVGAFYTEEDSTNIQQSIALDLNGAPIAPFSPFFAFAELPSDYTELAVFGDVTFKFTDSFDITAGVRWAENDQNFRQISGGAIVPVADDPGDSSEDVFTWMVTPRLRVGEDTMMYARVATGYRPGGPNVFLPTLPIPPSVESDELINYEVGVKTQFNDNRALVNAAVYRIDWKDVQQIVDFGGVSGLGNAGEARSQGVEIESLFAVTERLRIGLNGAYTDAEITSNPQGTDNLVGGQLPGSPELTASLTVDYSFPVGTWTGRVGGGYRYVDEQQTDVIANSENRSYVLPSYDVLDLNAGLANDRWTLRLFARNVTDERAYTGGGLVVDGLNQPLFIDVTPLQPRTIGLALDVTF